MNLNRPSNYEKSRQIIKDLHKKLSKSLQKQRKVNVCLSQQIKTLQKHLQTIEQNNQKNRKNLLQKNTSQLIKSSQITKNQKIYQLNKNIQRQKDLNNEQIQCQIEDGKQDALKGSKNNRRLKDQIMSKGFPASAKINKMGKLPYRFRI